MKGKSVFSGLTEKLETNKKLKWMVYGALMLTALVIFLSSLGSKKENADNISTTTDQVLNSSAGVDSYAYQLESRLEKILSGMRGVGRVQVMLVLDSRAETVIASEEQSSKTDSGITKSIKPSTVSSSSGEEPIILTELMPTVCGVIVVAEGAGDVAVQLDIISAVSTVLGIKQGKVQVFEMNTKYQTEEIWRLEYEKDRFQVYKEGHNCFGVASRIACRRYISEHKAE